MPTLPTPAQDLFHTIEDAILTKGAPTAASAQSLSDQLRTGHGGHLRERRRVVAFSLVAAGSMSLIASYQVGLIRRLPNPPLPYFDAEKVDASTEAYAKLETPDALLGLASYAVTACLAATGGMDRARTQPWLPLALAGKVLLFDTPMAIQLTISQWTKHRAFCAWCLLASALTLASVPAVVPEAVAAIKALRGHD